MLVKLTPVLSILVAVIVTVLTVTALPAVAAGPLDGTMLMAHMAASGALVFALPVLGLAGLGVMIRPGKSVPSERVGFWAVLLTGWLSIATVFLCMLPIVGTEAMHGLI